MIPEQWHVDDKRKTTTKKQKRDVILTNRETFIDFHSSEHGE